MHFDRDANMAQIWALYVSRRIGPRVRSDVPPQGHSLCGSYMQVTKQTITKIFFGFGQLTTYSISHIRSPCAQAIHCQDLMWLWLKGLWPMWPHMTRENQVNKLLGLVSTNMCPAIHCQDLLWLWLKAIWPI
jgi:hypothetical protein